MKSSKLIKDLRSHLGLTQKVFAARIGVTQSYISQLETGEVDVSLSLFLSWCSIFELTKIKINILNKNISYN